MAATQCHDAAAGDPDAWLFLDLDLSVLAQAAARHDAYSATVRAEYA
jgi:predicted metal-dependent HD superfamily phosphohydrolase